MLKLDVRILAVLTALTAVVFLVLANDNGAGSGVPGWIATSPRSERYFRN
jgi:hypothetical protein